MKSILRNRVFVCGVLSPLVGIFLYVMVYSTLTSLSSNLENDWVCRLVISTFAMIIPNLFTFALAVKQSQQKPLSILSKVGVIVAILALGLTAKPVSDGILRVETGKEFGLHDVAAPLFETPDISGTVERLSDQKGKVVLINVWGNLVRPRAAAKCRSLISCIARGRTKGLSWLAYRMKMPLPKKSSYRTCP